MKIIIGAIILVVVMAGVLRYSSDTVSYVKEQVEVTVEVIPDWAQDPQAVEAAKAVIRKKELEKESEDLKLQIEKLQTRKNEVDKELGTFWREASNVKALIRAAFPEEPLKAIAIAQCESGLRPTAHNPTNKDGSTDGGLWQINSVHDKRLKELGLDKYNPEDATKFARLLYDERGGFQDWVCYTKGMHVAYLR